jgi:hypothetical protein
MILFLFDKKIVQIGVTPVVTPLEASMPRPGSDRPSVPADGLEPPTRPMLDSSSLRSNVSDEQGKTPARSRGSVQDKVGVPEVWICSHARGSQPAGPLHARPTKWVPRSRPRKPEAPTRKRRPRWRML